ncbi:MAG: cyclic nucleotide-binding domain-containing protein [Gammaproteobacteria bacterium]|nr:cyclic nucleotide-binding domain-containing protein [Gammaproteobacteria bacterium]NIM74832.1 cyclic nucleotide-binding domain-containing protein [Gammaproteobacteria bacterium]NIN39264.1 cyclic nucleotide-binding domain-containing protein [Gammaproteobacteria bacterium]NIO26750.1 cyclic nucleotide-binding domain-containing protein [Gammaproteobacteria bacterium]NIO67306.1 cyclic nucleotide-binding domain-containing protein [Gammaproteobacteria bacterium]
MDIQRETETLSKVPLFSKLEQSKLKLLAFTSELQTYSDGEVVVNEGDAADCAFVIMEGQADIYANTESGEVVVGTLMANQLLGELGVLTNAPRAATIRANGKVIMLRIGGEMFLRLLAENPSVALDVMRQLSGKLVLAHRQNEELQDRLHQLTGS